jgi:hypothetical protein
MREPIEKIFARLEWEGLIEKTANGYYMPTDRARAISPDVDDADTLDELLEKLGMLSAADPEQATTLGALRERLLDPDISESVITGTVAGVIVRVSWDEQGESVPRKTCKRVIEGEYDHLPDTTPILDLDDDPYDYGEGVEPPPPPF